jgi:hypothetical protein
VLLRLSMVRLFYPLRPNVSFIAALDLYLSGNALNGLQLPRELAQEMVRTIRPHLQPTNRIGFDTAQQHLLDRLYNNQFQVRHFPCL